MSCHTQAFILQSSEPWTAGLPTPPSFAWLDANPRRGGSGHLRPPPANQSPQRAPRGPLTGVGRSRARGRSAVETFGPFLSLVLLSPWNFVAPVVVRSSSSCLSGVCLLCLPSLFLLDPSVLSLLYTLVCLSVCSFWLDAPWEAWSIPLGPR